MIQSTASRNIFTLFATIVWFLVKPMVTSPPASIFPLPEPTKPPFTKTLPFDFIIESSTVPQTSTSPTASKINPLLTFPLTTTVPLLVIFPVLKSTSFSTVQQDFTDTAPLVYLTFPSIQETNNLESFSDTLVFSPIGSTHGFPCTGLNVFPN